MVPEEAGTLSPKCTHSPLFFLRPRSFFYASSSSHENKCAPIRPSSRHFRKLWRTDQKPSSQQTDMRIHRETSAPIEAWEVKLEIMTDRPTDQPTNRYGSFTSNNDNYTSNNCLRFWFSSLWSSFFSCHPVSQWSRLLDAVLVLETGFTINPIIWSLVFHVL